jgi:outer membrane lipopolysaccharide assembly protein LptE/RlpB
MRRILTVLAVGAAVTAGAWFAWHLAMRDRGRYPIPGEGERITVEVLNATGIDGLARATTRQLRHAGIDVVYFGTAAMDTLQETVIAVRRGELELAARIRRALGVGRAVWQPDERLLLDASVFLGSDVAPLVHFGP